jgi:hypothetical protein
MLLHITHIWCKYKNFTLKCFSIHNVLNIEINRSIIFETK